MLAEFLGFGIVDFGYDVGVLVSVPPPLSVLLRLDSPRKDKELKYFHEFSTAV